MQIDELRDVVRRAVEDSTLTYRQRVQRLAGLAEEVLPPPPVSEACRAALDKRIVCDMFEGNAPYRPRYVLPDYASALRQGSAHLELAPPEDLDDALWFLLSVYAHVPSITGYPVFLGDIGDLLEPFAEGVDDAHLERSLRRFWRTLDRVLPDAFVHANLGPDDGRVVRTVLRLERELLQVVPNLTLKVDPERTPDDLVLDAVHTVFACGKPHFVNHPMMVAGLGDEYGVVSCYNSLPRGGGSHTLVRLNLKNVVLQHTGGAESFLDDALPWAVELTAELVEARVRYLVEGARFYEHSWLVHEGLLDPARFGAMFGIFGLAEAVDLLMEREGHEGARYGHDPAANELSYRITARVAELVAARPVPHVVGGRCFLHSQSGIDLDLDVTAGTRIPIGTEPGLYEHLRTVAPHHHLFTAGISDIVHVDRTATRNPQAVVDIVRGGFREGMRDVTFNLDGNGFIRITGYLVRASDVADVLGGGGARHGSTFLGAGAEANTHVTGRRVQRVVSHESSPRPGR